MLFKNLKNLKTLTKDIGLLTTALTLALVANFAYGQWNNPTASPPNNNAATPINVSNSNQVKTGGLSTGALSVVGNQGLTGELRISNGGPRIRFSDTTTGDRDFWTYVNSSTFYVLVDRNNDGAWDSPHPMRLTVGGATNGTQDYATFSNQVRARAYCDENGANCFDPNEVGAVSCVSVPYVRTIPVPFSGGSSLVNCAWNDWGCMSNYCVSAYGGWAGYHASAIRVSGSSLSVFYCFDWDLTSSCHQNAINRANETNRTPY